MHLVEDVLHGYLGVFVVVFIDDILVYFRNTIQNAEHPMLSFKRLKKHQIIYKASKCTLHVNEIEFLGQWMSLEVASPIVEKLCVVRDWEAQNSVKDVRSFLGFANYCCQYVPRYARIASPLTLWTKKNIEWNWAPVQRKAFSELKSALCNTSLLIFPNPWLSYTMVIDASADAIGGVLMQYQRDRLSSVAFVSRV